MSRLGLGLGITKGGVIPFNPLSLNPYLLFDTQSSMIGTFENPTLDLDPSVPSTLDVITATRAGVATFTDANGLIATAPANTVRVDQTQGAELTPTKFQRVPYSTPDSNWATTNSTLVEDFGVAPDGTQSASKVTKLAVSGNNSANDRVKYPSIAITNGTTYSVSVHLKNIDVAGFTTISARVSGGSLFRVKLIWDTSVLSSDSGTTSNRLVEDVGNGWYRVSFSFDANGSAVNFEIDIDRSTGGREDNSSILVWGAQLEEGTTASDFVANTTGSPKFITGATFGPRVPMILVEPSATNLLPYSEDFSNAAWTKNNASVTGGFTSPDGTNNAFLMTDDATDSKHGVYEVDICPQDSSIYTRSVFVKKATARYIVLSCRHIPTSSGTSWIYDTDANDWVLTGSGGVAQSIEIYGDGWVRLSISHISNSNSNNDFSIGIANGATVSDASYSGSGDSVYIWGAQIETGSVSTSYIPTAGGDAAARTRAADDLTIDPDSTNHITNTDFSTWSTQRMTVSNGAGYGGYNSSIITAIESTGNKRLTATLSGVTAGQTHTSSIYVRRVSGSGTVQFENQGSTSGGDHNVTSQVGSDWTRIDTQFNGSTSGGVVTGFAIRLFTEGDSLEIAMPQVELGSSPTGFIPTSGAPASRTTFSDFYNQSAGTFYVESVPNENTSGSFLFDLSFGDASTERLNIFNGSGNQKVFLRTAGTTWTDNVIGSRPAGGAFSRVAISYKTNDVRASLDGVNMATDTSATVSSTLNKMTIGNRYQNPNYLNGRIRRILFWPYHSDNL